MDNITEFITLGVELLLISIVIIFAVNLNDIGTMISKTFSHEVLETNSDIVDARYTKYTTEINTGSDVVSAIRKFRDELEVKVTIKTSASTQTTFSSTSLGTSFQNYPTNSNYINPSASFTCELIKPAGVILGLWFKQVSYVAPVSAVAPASLVAPTTLLAAAPEAANFSMMTEYDESGSESEIIFSDEVDYSGATEESVALDSISVAVLNYSSQLDELLDKIGLFDPERDSVDKLDSVIISLTVLHDNLENLLEQCKNGKFDKEQKIEISSQIEETIAAVDSALSDIEKLKKETAEKRNSADTWWVGYPVKESVKAHLAGGTLTLSGTGDVSVGKGLPRWLDRSDDIKKVVIEDGVTPKSMDYWFSGCTNLCGVSPVPESVTSMNRTFSGCSALTGSIDVKGKNVTEVNGFRNCEESATLLKVKVLRNSETYKTFNKYLNIDNGSTINVELIEK